MGAAVHFLCRVLVVRAAEQAEGVELVPMCAREAVDVIDLERASFLAAFSPVVDERAPAAVPLVDGALHRVGDVARFGFHAGFQRGARRAANREAFLLHFGYQLVERDAEERREVAVGYAVPQEILRLANLVSELARDAELYLVRRFCHRRDRPRRRCGGLRRQFDEWK